MKISRVNCNSSKKYIARSIRFALGKPLYYNMKIFQDKSHEKGSSMQIAPKIHALKIPFTVPVSPDTSIDRSVYVYLVIGQDITLIDCGVKGSQETIFDYIAEQGRQHKEIHKLILSHSHPDHIGSARKVHEQTCCTVLAHSLEKGWIEDTTKQKEERPVPGFDFLVEGPVHIDATLEQDQILHLDHDVWCQIFHTPGHSPGSISLFFPDKRILFTGDALPLPDDLPIYDDLATLLISIKKLKKFCDQADTVLSSWEEPIKGTENINQRLHDGIAYLERIHHTVVDIHQSSKKNGMDLCQSVIAELGLPTFAANPLTAKAFMSSLSIADQDDLFRN